MSTYNFITANAVVILSEQSESKDPRTNYNAYVGENA